MLLYYFYSSQNQPVSLTYLSVKLYGIEIMLKLFIWEPNKRLIICL